MKKKFILKILRGHPGEQYWEEFELERKRGSNVISMLMEIQRNPVNRSGESVAPVVWDSGCLEEVCGSCSMLINGKPRQACTAIIETILEETESDLITLAPFTKFPLARDLIIDRSSMFENLKKVSAWVEVDGTQNSDYGPKISQEKQEVMYQLAECMTCGCCLEACPQVDDKSPFMGAQVLGQVRFFNLHPVAALKKAERLRSVMGNAGVSAPSISRSPMPLRQSAVTPRCRPFATSLACLREMREKVLLLDRRFKDSRFAGDSLCGHRPHAR
jgi:succinate dehydrogenase / fumarate reductase iron-sulfur subunit